MSAPIYSRYQGNSGGGGSGVTSLNGLTGNLTLLAGSGITVTPSGSDITIAATGGGGTPGGASGSVQFNNSGTFGGFGDWDGTTLATVAVPTATSGGAPSLYLSSNTGTGAFAYGSSSDVFVGFSYNGTAFGWESTGHDITQQYFGYTVGGTKVFSFDNAGGVYDGTDKETQDWVQRLLFGADGTTIPIDYSLTPNSAANLSFDNMGNTYLPNGTFFGPDSFVFQITNPNALTLNQQAFILEATNPNGTSISYFPTADTASGAGAKLQVSAPGSVPAVVDFGNFLTVGNDGTGNMFFGVESGSTYSSAMQLFGQGAAFPSSLLIGSNLYLNPAGTIGDASNLTSVDTNNRKLLASDGSTTNVDYSNPGRVLINSEPDDGVSALQVAGNLTSDSWGWNSNTLTSVRPIPSGGAGIDIYTTNPSVDSAYFALTANTGVVDENVWAFYVNGADGTFNFQPINDAWNSGANVLELTRAGNMSLPVGVITDASNLASVDANNRNLLAFDGSTVVLSFFKEAPLFPDYTLALNPDQGMIAYDFTNNTPIYYDGTSWIDLGGGGGPGLWAFSSGSGANTIVENGPNNYVSIGDANGDGLSALSVFQASNQNPNYAQTWYGNAGNLFLGFPGGQPFFSSTTGPLVIASTNLQFDMSYIVDLSNGISIDPNGRFLEGPVSGIMLDYSEGLGTGSLSFPNAAVDTSGSGLGTLSNVPGGTAGGNPTGYLVVFIGGVQSYIPYWQ